MGVTTGITWTDHTFNPVWGCAHVSPGCANCYAETFAQRTGYDVWGAKGARRTFGERYWAQPLRWNAHAEAAGIRERVFCASMADVFEDHSVWNTERPKLWGLIQATPWLDWQILTKRPENIPGMLPALWGDGWPNVWLGVSVEDQQRADARVPRLISIPAAVHFLSCEPLLGPVLIPHRWLVPVANLCEYYGRTGRESDRALAQILRGAVRKLDPSYRRWFIDWVIIGGESGPGFRAMDPVWASSIAETCDRAGVAVWCKQDSGLRPGSKGRLSDALWARKEFPTPTAMTRGGVTGDA